MAKFKKLSNDIPSHAEVGPDTGDGAPAEQEEAESEEMDIEEEEEEEPRKTKKRKAASQDEEAPQPQPKKQKKKLQQSEAPAAGDDPRQPKQKKQKRDQVNGSGGTTKVQPAKMLEEVARSPSEMTVAPKKKKKNKQVSQTASKEEAMASGAEMVKGPLEAKPAPARQEAAIAAAPKSDTKPLKKMKKEMGQASSKTVPAAKPIGAFKKHARDASSQPAGLKKRQPKIQK